MGPAIAKGLVMGVIAGVPVPVIPGTAAGGIFLAWAGLHQWVQLPFSRDRWREAAMSTKSLAPKSEDDLPGINLERKET